FGLVVGVAASGARAGTPDYLKLGLHPGQSLEFTGKLNTDHVFVATDVESLPQARKPQLRGGIEAVHIAHHSITLLGLSILVPPDTVSGNPDSTKVSLEHLAAGMCVEVSCSVKDTGEWVAKRIRTQLVKPSDKLKGTLTRVAVDGAPPDTVEVSGFKVVLGADTDFNRQVGGGADIRDVLQRDMAAASARDALLGHASADGRLLLRLQMRGQLAVARELDLSPHVGTNGEATSPELRAALTGYFGPHVRTRAQLRAKGQLYLQSQLGSVNSSAVQMLEANVLAKDLFGRGLAIQVGRQDLDEPREWIFNQYQDAVRVAAVSQRGFSAE